ncbi:phosphate ABC transporter permease PstA [Halocatena pleomorpha]|uniref:Phosphate transport system permease protein PstA n=1 Tax=Halocatena pleomorpha TaxID=1785090 RepID=A0A3P3R4C8_9EURY|nr:phosphate ABC transporter permease PstA [Halocatena pleomorpha]RRJ28322.1 phosphate ABC transporter permease PstA [Halocatena pleomorpha]
MATDTNTNTNTETASGFGEVSRIRGVVFRYVLLVATLSGLVSLGMLLTNVAVDAIRPFSADPGWYATYLVAFLCPSVLVGLFLYSNNRDALAVGVEGLFVPIAGLFGAGTLLLLFEAIAFYVWFAWIAAIAVPALVYAGCRALDLSTRTRTIAVLVIGWIALLGVPVSRFVAVPDTLPLTIESIPSHVLTLLVLGIPEYIQFHVLTIPNRYLTYLFTLALPAALYMGHRVRHKESWRFGLLTSALVIIAALSVVFQIVLPPGTVLILVLAAAVPTAYYVVMTIRHRPDVRIGLLFPAVIVVGALLGRALVWLLGMDGPTAWIDMAFLTSTPSGMPKTTGINPALVGSLLLMVVVIASSFPLGVGAAVYLEEYAPDTWYTRFIQLNISNLAGVPSVVYGLLGLGLFINLGGFSGQTVSIAGTTVTLSGLPAGSLLAGGLAISLLILPIVIISSQEAIRSVPDSLRQASFGMGATQWQTIKNVVLPRSIPGILTGTILAIGRAVGETAPLIMVLAADFKVTPPTSLFDKTSALPLQVYNWAFLPDEAFRHGVLAAGVVTMIVVLLSINSIAIVVRNKYETEQQ